MPSSLANSNSIFPLPQARKISHIISARLTVMRYGVHHMLSTLHHQVLAAEALWDDNAKGTKQTFRLAVPRKQGA
jgi:hypothetical protein